MKTSLLNEDGMLPAQSEGTDLEVEVAEEGKESLLEEEEDGEEDGYQHDNDYEIPLPLRGRQFANIDALHDALETLGLTDYKFQLDSEGYVTMPDTKHNEASDFIRDELDEYCRGWFGRWGKASNLNVQEVNRLTLTGKQAKRLPDVNFWTYQKCDKVVKGKLRPQRRSDTTDFEVDPDVFFQFSWGNTEPREFAAMNDIMTLGGMGAGNAGPRVGFLVKVRRVGVDDVAVGIDVYKVVHGRTVADAIAQTHGCTHTYYNRAAGNDVTIEIPAAELGFTGVWVHLLPNFKLSLQDVWEYAVLG